MKNLALELTRIVQELVLIDSALDQANWLVDSICGAINVDVCRLYKVSKEGSVTLFTGNGVDYDQVSDGPGSKKIASLIAQLRHSINIPEISLLPDYSSEGAELANEPFHGFCGVPLVHLGEVVGVCTVQNLRAEKLSDEYEAFLVTLAPQLSLVLSDTLRSDVKPSMQNAHSVGVKGAPGVGIGTVQLCNTNELANVVDMKCGDVEGSIKQWHELLTTAKLGIAAEQAALSEEVSDHINSIFDVYQLLLSDQSLITKVEAEIKLGHWLPSALRLSIHYFSEMFRSMEDPYLKARHEDIQHLGNKLYSIWKGGQPNQKSLISTDQQIVLVGSQVSVSDIASIPIEQLVGIVCFEGSSLSHTAVLANALGVPAVMGVGYLKGLQSEEELIVDGNEARIIRKPSIVLLDEYKQLLRKEQDFLKRLGTLRDEPAVTLDEVNVKLLTNTGLMADISPGLNSGAEGVGLYRTEIPFMVRNSFPSEDEQVKVYRHVLRAYKNKPVYMRILDIGGDKQLPYFPISNESNPALGWRGIRFALDNIQLLMTQVRAMIRAADGGDNLYILLPMVSTSDELVAFAQLLEDACEQLAGEGVNLCKPKVGIMIEVPAAISQLALWHNKIDFISIGSNDLSQYLLALDRNNARVAAHYDHVHPAVLCEINRIVMMAKQYNLPLSLCGEMASDPVAVVLLLGMGVRSLSISAAKLPLIKHLIRSISAAEAKNLFMQAMTISTAREIRSLVKNNLDFDHFSHT